MLNILAFFIKWKKPNDDIPVFCLKAGRIVRSVDSQGTLRSESLEKLEEIPILRCGRDLYKTVLFSLMTIIQ